MKKVFITMIAFLAMSSAAMANGHVDSVRYLTTKSGKNWYISAGATCNWWQGSMRTPDGFAKDYTAVEWGKPNFGFTANVGKWINHTLAFRVRYDNTNINSYIDGRHSGLDHIQFLYGSDNPTPVETVGNYEIYATSMRYHNLMADLMFSPIDFFQGYYNADRIWTPVIYASAGGAFISKDLFALQTVINNSGKDEENKDGANFELALGAGLCNNFKLSKHFDINLDLNWTFQRWSIDSWTYEFGGVARPKRFDNLYTASLGLTYYFSREYDLPVNCCAEMDSLQRKLDDFLNAEPDPNAAGAETPCDTIVKFISGGGDGSLSYPFSIFFNRDSYQLMSRRDIVNLREIANVAKEHGYKLRLTGSCDSATATPAYNQTLSENRCNKIKQELMQLGVPESQIIINPIGGVKDLDPTEYDRRVLIQLQK
jgi:outer membrane protein OmpA-like peptidoglycan-associated protein